MVPVALVEVVLVATRVATTELLLGTSGLQSNVLVVRTVCKPTLYIHVPNVLVHHKCGIPILPWLFPSSAVATLGLAEQPFSTQSVLICPLVSPGTVLACHCLLMRV